MADSRNLIKSNSDQPSVSLTPWVLGALGILAIAGMIVVWLPGGPTSQSATQNSKSPIAKTPDQAPPPLKPQPR